MSKDSSRVLHMAAIAILALTWGSSFILMKRALKDDSNQPVLAPEQVAALRMGIASAILLPVSLNVFRKIKIHEWKYLAVVGLMGSGIPAILFTTAQLYIDSSLAGILNALTPLFTLLIGIAFFRKSFHRKQLLGVAIGLAGAVSLIALQGMGSSQNPVFAVLIIAATLCYGISVNTIYAKIAHIHPLHITALSLLMAGIPYTLYLTQTNITDIVYSNPYGWKAVGYVAVLAILGTCLANMLYFWLTQQTSPLFASSVTYIMPMVAVGWGLGDGETFGLTHIGCAILVLLGVWLVNKK
ncbi:MAG: DMT family transporter [Flavobacteriales bacterium]